MKTVRTTSIAAVVAAAVMALGTTGAMAQDTKDEESKRTLNIDLKAQVYVESTNFGSGLDRQGRRTDVHFQALLKHQWVPVPKGR